MLLYLKGCVFIMLFHAEYNVLGLTLVYNFLHRLFCVTGTYNILVYYMYVSCEQKCKIVLFLKTQLANIIFGCGLPIVK